MKNRCLHIMSNDKFTIPYIQFVNENFLESGHLFLIYGKGVFEKLKQYDNIVELYPNVINIFYMIKKMHENRRIIFHGFTTSHYIYILCVFRWLLKKSYWCMWGADLYYYKYRDNTLKSNVYELCRRIVIKNIAGLITYIKKDYQLAQKWYGAKGKYYHCIMYPSNFFREYDFSQLEKTKGQKLYIQIGNSADPTNNHIEMLNRLSVFRDEDIEIICPLAYGNLEYRDKIINEGKKIYNDKFKPLLSFMEFSAYTKLLAKIDVAIFNHERQQAMGNIIVLLGLGKKVYIRDDISTWDFCKENKLIVFNTKDRLLDIFSKISNQDQINNISLTKKIFSEEKLKEQLKNIFES